MTDHQAAKPTPPTPAANQRADEQHQPGRDDPAQAGLGTPTADAPERPDTGVFRSGAPSGEVAPH